MFIAADYIYWHYVIAVRGIFSAFRNYLTGNWHRFLISRHFRTLFSPWHRVKPSDIGKAKTLGDKMGDKLADGYTRLLAAFVRTLIILTGLLYEAGTVFVFVCLIIVWLAWPAVFVILLTKGLTTLF